MTRNKSVLATAAVLAGILIPAIDLRAAPPETASGKEIPSSAMESASDTAQIDPKAEALLKADEGRLGAIPSLTAEVTEDLHLTPGSMDATRYTHIESLAKPNYRHDEWRMGRTFREGKDNKEQYSPIRTYLLINNGKTGWMYDPINNQYRETPSQQQEPAAMASQVESLDPLSGFYNPATSFRSGVRTLIQEKRLHALHLLKNETWADESCQVVEIVYSGANRPDRPGAPATGVTPPVYTTRLLINSDNLIRHIETTGNNGRATEWTLRNLKTGDKVDPARFAFTLPKGATPFTQRQEALTVGTPAPNFTMIAADGRKVQLSDYKGKVLVMDYWATWCQPCQKAMPHLQQVYEALKQRDDVVVFALCVWDQKRKYEKWRQEKAGVYSFPVAFDPAAEDLSKAITLAYHIDSIPTQIVVAKDGTIAATLGEESKRSLEETLAGLGIAIPEAAKAPRPSIGNVEE